MAKRNSKVAKYRKPKQPKMGLIIFGIIFFYVVINIIIYMNKEHLSIYEVAEGQNVDDNTCKGIILRNEEVVNTDTSGYVNYYYRDGERIAKKATVYTIDETGKVYEQLMNSENETKLTNEDIETIRNQIATFKNDYSKSQFSNVYDFKYDIENSILELSNLNMLSNLQDIMSSNGDESFRVVKANNSGIITYFVDSYENLKAEDITKESFDTSKYKKLQLRTTDLLEKGSPVYKVVRNENWSIVINLTKEQYDKVSNKEQINITFPKDNLSTYADITTFKKSNEYYAKLDLNKYMIHYIDDRFIDVELNINSATGLKIPVTSVVKKKFYKIPLEYFTEGGDTGSYGVVKEVYSKNGDVKYQFIKTEIYYKDDKYGYVDTNDIKAGGWIKATNTKERYEVSETGTLEGAYNVNKGYAVFRRIEKIYENEEYCIIKNDTEYGLSVYDHIALNGDKATDQHIIY
ncbi:HlyD family efflux transporter periplasmic adaptor subunit [Anaeromicropila herbilytica]|uniref:RND related barrel-sandwich hybrid domain-containing protein n=1 Tax=Anaeromicropila herbilytica TaxID=2785025 RepID=A0A7R7ELZ4_9FIRM|nr:HlyD family efflux transporter periplasmic adaptor subunit [Anaeromicropila herbilytica]BCN31199.1 hypothetical protein bsdtb5_24940 [Anaeromicropila herbilytica]